MLLDSSSMLRMTVFKDACNKDAIINRLCPTKTKLFSSSQRFFAPILFGVQPTLLLNLASKAFRRF